MVDLRVQHGDIPHSMVKSIIASTEGPRPVNGPHRSGSGSDNMIVWI